MINIYFGGTLYQDILTERKDSIVHRDPLVYDQLTHDIDIVEGTIMHKLTGKKSVHVNSVHHQGINDKGKNIEILASCKDDQVAEAIHWTGAPDGKVMGVQWHPEFFYNCEKNLFDTDILFRHFLSFINK